MDLYLENVKLNHVALGSMGNGKTHIFADSIVSYFGMKYESGVCMMRFYVALFIVVL